MASVNSNPSMQRWLARLTDLPQLVLPTDYARPSGAAMVEAHEKRTIDDRIGNALVRLALYDELGDDSDSDSDSEPEPDQRQSQQNQREGIDQTLAARGARDHRQQSNTPTPFHLLLASFVVLLHRFTGENDLVIATSSPSSPDPLLLRIKLEPSDSFWSLVKRVQWLEQDAENDKVPYEKLLEALGRGKRSEAERGQRQDGLPEAPLFRVRFFDETDETETSFVQQTSLTSDLTVFVTSTAHDSLSAAASGSSLTPSASGTATPTSLRTSLRAPTVALTLSYNSLVFSQPRMATMLDQLLHLVHHAAAHPLDAIGSISLLTHKQRKVLPDPRADLEWTGYQGAITDIFSRNARAFPDRTCIVESLSPTAVGGANRLRSFTYQQIDKASNVLAHHLVASGVEREEVVTVYSTRGVDLVVAVMGVLKAGATFSVIDPAYPPARQIIYLQVAQPRALVILAAAGSLLPPVRKYASESLKIRVEVPAMQLLASSFLLGSAPAESEPDALDGVRSKAGQALNIPLGPDSIGTLSFTSGSTGIPKGVRGRHFSLTHFFPWMSKTFGLSETSRFTMLSGIAHDPIQRDIFTPLFLGAELHIPTAEDIGTPGRLAEWMADSKVTITHLTPAMGQLLSAQATRSIPSLLNAFFVGDVLTKRDCTRLQQLANNVRIINMFGTTETQRAVSYFAIPSLSTDPTFLKLRKDIMPAGQGMINVQLLVVNRNDKNQICAVGEVGEIYVRSGGLAEGYLQLPESTAEKFVANWFGTGVEREDLIQSGDEAWKPYWKGVRDRMYRSGDLGRYNPDGTVECTGRADDQIKIRGFRIELGEIDTHLSRHPAVRENVTLVRRDKYEEKVLVAYFVPLMGSKELEGLVSGGEDDGAGADKGAKVTASEVAKGLKKYRRLIKDIRDYLKTKLPSYSIPTVFVPLTRMPLNPNGKVDKPALPFPDTVTAAAATTTTHAAPGSAPTLSVTERAIHDIWLKLLPSPPAQIPTDESFFDLGGHSILATRLIFELRTTLAIGAPLGIVFDHPTVAGLAKELDRLRDSDLGLASGERTAKSGSTSTANDDEYAEDMEKLVARLHAKYEKPQEVEGPKTVFLTGATGFLGAFILKDLLVHRQSQVKKVICHVRAKSPEAAVQRLRESGQGRDAWDEAWVEKGRVEAVTGDLEADKLGMSEQEWDRTAQEADIIIHNGALVHWIYPYAKLRAANVLATLAVLDLAAATRPKVISFISTTAVIEKGHYVRLGDYLVQQGSKGVPESDPLDAGKEGLKGGYGQSKWVSERLILEAGRRGLAGAIVRPAYVVGDSTSAVTNTDDFLWRLVKGCIQLGHIPDIHNSINMTPVDHVARIIAISALQSPSEPLRVHQVSARPPPRFNQFLSVLQRYGYQVKKTEYLPWRTLLEQHVLKSQDNALFPLLHFVLDDLPTSTKAAEIDDSNTIALLKKAGEVETMTVDDGLVGLYLAWLVAAGFLEAPAVPASEGKNVLTLPALRSGQVAKAIGRSSGHAT
ncbi:L-aminoadipate-semialdehyde dehydrogenase [Microbotryum lychnidis-dioicae p1A1 Lamole]|uniref:Alpha-aminoadipate reductase n=1 Tax=Microbotryum lychnidis-dioicae (strain p1A1 Lamole / MvSl-1064) TaxID=683840 RepID=U5H1S9_USTV1|nr:L-aminoadipate-semialdehyde dehydrogenase [Microbotryum lychnidis-dioicae p1A1 Lamole]|eukprot:KDE08553.1 L-aminoadipate-semialdehyde dehydrogenase [Microbotryum lychnidis-dioicae p1A1 Lamole]